MSNLFKNMNIYYRLAQITPVAIFILMMLGSYVKSIDAGLSCPDWPLCYGQIYPGSVQSVYTFEQIMAEYIHRFVALLVSILIFILFFYSLSTRNNTSNENVDNGNKRFKMMSIVVILLGIQIIFGALTVLLLLEPFVVSVHLGFATLLFGASIFHLNYF